MAVVPGAEPPLVFLVAGEPSGDALGGKLMRALKEATGDGIRFAGVGGERMEAEGLRSLFPLQDIAVMGLTEVLPQVPTILRRLRLTADAIRRERPAAIVSIDAPAFCFRLADRVRDLRIPIIHYVAPQLWAWRPGRVRKLAGRIDHLMLLLPFEAAFFERAGIRSTYVGHPVLEDAAPGDAPAFRARHGLSADAPLLLMLPGSRRGLASRMLPVFGAALNLLLPRRPDLRVAIPVVAGTAEAVQSETASWPSRPLILRDPAEKRAAYAAATAALTVSGTATMELAVAGVPMAVTYKVSGVSAWLARRLIQVPHVAMPNLVAGRIIVPELLQEDCTPARMADVVGRLLSDPGARAAQRAALAEVCGRLGRAGPRPSARAAAVVLDEIRKR